MRLPTAPPLHCFFALTLTLAPVATAFAARGPACKALFAAAANNRTEALIKAAIAEGYDRDGECMALAAMAEVALGQLSQAHAHASRAVTIDPASGLAQLGSTAIDISVRASRAHQRGAPPAEGCGTAQLSRQVKTLQMGVIMMPATGLLQLAVARLEDLARLCVDDGSILIALQTLCANSAVRSPALELLDADMKRLGRIGIEHLPKAGITPYALAMDLSRSVDWKSENWEQQPPVSKHAAPWVREMGMRGLQLLLGENPKALAQLTRTAVLLALGVATADAVLLMNDPANAGRVIDDAIYLGKHGGFAEPEIVNRLAPAAAGLWGLSIGTEEFPELDELLRHLQPIETSGPGAFATVIVRGVQATSTQLSACQRASAVDDIITKARLGLLQLSLNRWAPFIAKLAELGATAARSCEAAAAIIGRLDHTHQSLGDKTVPEEWLQRMDIPDGSTVEAPTAKRRSR